MPRSSSQRSVRELELVRLGPEPGHLGLDEDEVVGVVAGAALPVVLEVVLDPALLQPRRLVLLDAAVEDALDHVGGPGHDLGRVVVGAHREDRLVDDVLVGVLGLVDDDQVVGLRLDLGLGVSGLHAAEAARLLQRDDLPAVLDDIVDLGVDQERGRVLGRQHHLDPLEQGLGLRLDGGEQAHPEAPPVLAEPARVDLGQPREQDHAGGDDVRHCLGLAALPAEQRRDDAAVADDEALGHPVPELGLVGVQRVPGELVGEQHDLGDHVRDEVEGLLAQLALVQLVVGVRVEQQVVVEPVDRLVEP
jgi:hypothetical protein